MKPRERVEESQIDLLIHLTSEEEFSSLLADNFVVKIVKCYLCSDDKYNLCPVLDDCKHISKYIAKQYLSIESVELIEDSNHGMGIKYQVSTKKPTKYLWFNTEVEFFHK